ncbi:hypothetical protein [Gluconobacter sp. Dm-44]|uniref:hypothetical protein n=1 Tax=Gluconobacter sp. Dm-44 TaxID=2799805 RepID=UPI0020128FAB|nr:hypothetical protein [Gluconobacter sp. Dm-44]
MKDQHFLPLTMNGVPVSSVSARRGRPASLTPEEKARRKKQGYADRQLMLHIGWNEVILARRTGMSLTSLRRSLSGDAPSLRPEIRTWMEGLSSYLKDNPPPRLSPLGFEDGDDLEAKSE